MNNLIPTGGDSGAFPSTQSLTKRGVAAAGFLIGGAGLLILGSLPAGLGIVLGAAACALGIGSAFSRDKTDRIGGSALFIGGALTLLSRLKIPILGGISRFALVVGAAVCIGLGIVNGIKFLRGLKERS